MFVYFINFVQYNPKLICCQWSQWRKNINFFFHFNHFSLQELAAESHGQVTDDWHVNNNTNTGDITTNEKTEMSDEKIHSASNDSLSTNDEEDSGKFLNLFVYISYI